MRWHRRFRIVGLTLLLLAGGSCTTSGNTLTEVPDAQPAQQPSLSLEDLVDGLDSADDLDEVVDDGLGDDPDGALGAVGNITDLLTCTEQKYVAVNETIGPEGGQIKVGEHTLDIPEKALSRKVKITAEQMRGSTNSVRFSPEGLGFERPARLTMSYENCTVVLLPKSIVYTTEEFTILEVLRSIDLFRQKTVSAPIDHFSRYAVAY